MQAVDFQELPIFFGWVNHDRNGTATHNSESCHRVYCSHSGCQAYAVEPHTYVYADNCYECTVCGYLTDTPMLNSLEDEELFAVVEDYSMK